MLRPVHGVAPCACHPACAVRQAADENMQDRRLLLRRDRLCSHAEPGLKSDRQCDAAANAKLSVAPAQRRNMHAIGVPTAQQTTLGSKNVTVGILDTGAHRRPSLPFAPTPHEQHRRPRSSQPVSTLHDFGIFPWTLAPPTTFKPLHRRRRRAVVCQDVNCIQTGCRWGTQAWTTRTLT